jgi:hypothetical protein
MTVGLNAAQARAKSSQDMIIFEECNTIMKQVITASATGNFDILVSDLTTMTTSTPSVQKIGTINNPVVNNLDTLIINGQSVTLGVVANTLDGIIADINNANLPGIVATKDNNFLVLNIDVHANSVWSYEIGAGTANASLGFIQGVYSIPADPESVQYFQSWQGALQDRAKIQQMNSVIQYFQNLGYKIERIANSTTGQTFKWHIYW